MRDKEFKALLDKYTAGRCTPEETAWLENAYLHWNENNSLPLSESQISHAQAGMWQHVAARTNPPAVRRLWPRIAAAASVIIAFAIGGYLLLRQPKPDAVAKSDPEKMLPVADGVVLTLDNGQRIALHAGRHGTIPGTSVRQEDSVLTYSGKESTAAINTVTNNSGRKFAVQLADGTEVVVDVQSSLTYPSVFNGPVREVTADGQAYFKVKHNTRQPFLVKTKNQTIEDIGTEFNVHSDQETRTTLVEGLVKVNNMLLKPGQMATTAADGKIRIDQANLMEATAWLQDKIIFKEASLEAIMKEVARVYQVNIIWRDDLRKRKFGAILSRRKPLSSVLNYFRAASDIDFKVENKTITIFQKPIK